MAETPTESLRPDPGPTGATDPLLDERVAQDRSGGTTSIGTDHPTVRRSI